MQTPLPAPTARGAFVKTPFPHLLLYALERRLSGTLELHTGALTAATITVIQGCPAKVRTHESVAFLGEVMTELGMITPEVLHASLERLREVPRLQGQILVELGVDPQAIEIGLRAQVERKIEHLFTLTADTGFAYYDGIDVLQTYGGPPTPIDPFPVLWRGVRESPPWEHVDATLRRLGPAGVRISPNAQVERFQFAAAEWQVIELMRQKPIRVLDLTTTKIVGPSIAQILIYFLMITKQVDLVDPASIRASNSAPPSSSNVAIPSGATGPGGPTSGQAFARVQLAARPVARTPMVVEEVSASSPANDERVSSPGTHAPFGAAIVTPPQPMAPAGAQSSPHAPNALDIGSLITQTIASSLPPPVTTMTVESIPGPAGVPMMPPISPQGAQSSPPAYAPPAYAPATSASAPSAEAVADPGKLTVEQNALKTKILERADLITSQDYFQMLGLDHEATLETVQKSFIALAKVWHPDRLPAALGDVKDACSKVFSHLTEAHATLTDAKRRHEYMTLLRDGGATPEDQAKIQAVLEAATEFQKAEFLMKRSAQDPQVFELVKRAVALDPEQAEYLALLTWLEAQRPEWLSREKTLEKIAVLDKCIQRNQNSERSYFYRGLLYKRIEEPNKAVKDFRKAADLNPRNLDAMREVRLHAMRGGTKPPPGLGSSSGAGSKPGSGRSSKPPQPESFGGLFGKLFKK